MYFFLSSRRRHTRCALVTVVQTCALPIFFLDVARGDPARPDHTDPVGGDRRVRVSTWSALAPLALPDLPEEIARRLVEEHLLDQRKYWVTFPPTSVSEIGRASCRESVCQSVWISGVGVSLKTKDTT